MTLILPLLFACSGSPTPAPEDIVPEYTGTYRVVSYDEGADCTADTPAEWGGTHAKIEVGSFFGIQTVDVYICTSETECDTDFSEFFMEVVDETSASGSVEGWSVSGGICSMSWNQADLVMSSGGIEINARTESNDDLVEAADLDACEIAMESYTGAVDCWSSERLVLEPI